MKSPVILRVFKGSQLVEVRQFDLQQIVIGTNPDSQLALAGEGVSAIHCMIERRDETYFISDMGSETGTFKNGQAVLDEPLSSGDEIEVGPFKIVYYFGVPKPKAAAPPVAAQPGVAQPGVAQPGAAQPGAAQPPAAAPSAPPATVAQATPVATPPPPAPPQAVAAPSATPEAPVAPVIPATPVAPAPPEAPAPIAAPPSPPPPETPAAAPAIPEKPVIREETIIPVPPPSIPERPRISEETQLVSKPMPAAAPQPSPAPAKPELKQRAPVASSKRKKKTSFAPPSQVQDLRQIVKPGKGNTVEVLVAWQERLIDTFSLKTRGLHKVGTTAGDAIRINSSELPKNWPLVNIGPTVQVNIPDSVEFELMVGTDERKSLETCLREGKAQRGSVGVSVRLDQGEMVCLKVDRKLNVFIRFAPMAPVVPLLPPLGLSGSELSGLTMALVLTALLAFYVSATTPKDLMEKPEEDVTLTAQIIFNNPPPRPPEPPPPPPPPPPPEQKPPPPPPPPKKVEMSDVKKEQQKKGQPSQAAQKNQTAGRAAEVAPIPNSQNRPKKFTSTKQGGAVKLGEKAGANAQSAKDVSKVGLFSAFGGGGVRSKLDQAYSGAGELLGQADKATGASGFAENRDGDDLGSKFKDTGAGGKGTATQGIAGIGTKGRSSGQSAYGSVGGFGDKTSVAVEAGGAEADFVGTIDREAVRRRVQHYLHEIRGCYNRELNRLEKGERLEGKVVVTWEIVAQGAAKNVRIKSSTLGNANVENCIRQRLASWSFPEPPVGMTAEVSYPFYLKAQN